MGEGIIQFYQTMLKKEYKRAFILTFIFVLLIHCYKFTNTLPNHDSVFNYYSNQNVLGSGRWALALACGMSSYYDLPWINGLLSSVFISLTVVVIVSLFKIKNPILIAITGALLAASPATTETFFFLFTADGYMIAMFLAALAVYFSRVEEKRLSRLILSGICICISCGIYQAYVSFALVLAVCYFIDVLLQNIHSKEDCLKWVFHQIVIYIVSLVSYYIIWKLCMYFSNTVANNYQGISEVGKISISLFKNGLISSLKTILLYFLQWNVIVHGFTLYSILNIIFIITFVIGLVIACIRSDILKRKWAFILFILCLFTIVPFACIWHFTSDSVSYRAMMLQSLTLLFILCAILYERWAKLIIKNFVCAFMTLIIINYSLIANIDYFYMNLCYESTYAEGVEMMVEIHNLNDKYDFNKIAIFGTRVNDVQHELFDYETGKLQNIGRVYTYSSWFEKSLLFDSDHTINYLKVTFGLELETLSRAERNKLLLTNEVKDMECWPSDDSMKVIDGTLVIKFSNELEEE